MPFIDSHTGGEPTRLILDGGLDLGNGSLQERAELFRSRHDHMRSGVVEEPRGSDVFVGALLCSPCDSQNTAGVIFFNNVDILGMCGHGMIGVIASLHHLGRIESGSHRIETPVGVVEAMLSPDGKVTIANVPSYRFRASVELEVSGIGRIQGDVAWGGNWFFLVPTPSDQPLELSNVRGLIDTTERIRAALERTGVHGADGAVIDHVELYSPSPTLPAGTRGARTFVLCPGGAWDRSPCGTGTSAKMACLAAAGALEPGEIWNQESIIGSVFEGSYQVGPGPVDDSSHSETPAAPSILPTISGTAHVMSEGSLYFDPDDPFCWGLNSSSQPVQ
ncbi:MAG: proline racemase family protein, partial [Thermoanaerobaculia bacterium]|nr:proline racemase family protein [Thermoanaerobaculia bacterium]